MHYNQESYCIILVHQINLHPLVVPDPSKPGHYPGKILVNTNMYITTKLRQNHVYFTINPNFNAFVAVVNSEDEVSASCSLKEWC